MDMMSYVEGKGTGAVTLTKVGFETYQIVAKRFDAATGKETFPEILTINRKSVEEARVGAEKDFTTATKRVEGVQQLIADLDALDLIL